MKVFNKSELFTNKNFLKTIALAILFTSSLNAFDFKSITSLISKNTVIKTAITLPANYFAKFLSCPPVKKLSNFIVKKPITAIALSVSIFYIAKFLTNKAKNLIHKFSNEAYVLNACKKNEIASIDKLFEKIGVNKAKKLVEKCFASAYKNKDAKSVITLLEFIDPVIAKILILKANVYEDADLKRKYKNRNFIEKFLNYGTYYYEPHYAHYWSCDKITLKMANLLISLGADVNEDSNVNRDNNRTPLYLACYYNKPEIIKLLVSNGADINKKCYDCWSPIFWAVYNNKLEIVKLLLSICKNINKSYLLYQSCCRDDRLEMLKLFIASGANINNKYEEGPNYRSPLYKACKKGAIKIVMELLENDVIVNEEVTNEVRYNDSSSYVWIIDESTKEVLKYLILAQNFDLRDKSNSFFDVPEAEKNNKDLCEFAKRFATSKRAKNKLKFTFPLNNKRALAKFGDCRIRITDSFDDLNDFNDHVDHNNLNDHNDRGANFMIIDA